MTSTKRSEMGLGYGSEYQLLRFLGHHRQELESIIHEQTRLKGKLEWLDYPKNDKQNSLDGEHKGISFLPLDLQQQLQQAWKNYWPASGTAQHWDAVLRHNEEWVIVEAKAYPKEIETDTGASTESRTQIQSAMSKTQERFGIKTENDWTQKYYQFANRLAFVNFLLDNGISASFLNIYFINGYDDKENDVNKSVKNIAQWEKAIADEYRYLGINDAAKKYIHEIFVEC